MRADHSFLLGFREHVHDALVALGPVAFSQAVHEQDVDIVDAKLFAESVNIGTHACRISCPRFRKHGDFVPLHVLERLRYVRMAAVGIRSVEETQAFVVTVQQEIGEALHAQRSLV